MDTVKSKHDQETKGPDVGGIASGRLRSFIERIEHMDIEKSVIAEDIKDIYFEAKSAGVDAKIMRQIVRPRKMSAADRSEQEAILALYKQALGMGDLFDDATGEVKAA